MTEHRVITEDERKELQPILSKLSVQNISGILRFVDTNLEKIYDVYLIKMQDETRILKQVGEYCADKEKYDTYFAGKDFSVPEVFEIFSEAEKHYVLMQVVEGVDARGCDRIQAANIGRELGKIQSFYLTDGGHTEAAERYWEFFEGFYEKLKGFFPDIDDVWEGVKQRFFEVPQTLIHEDLLPINVLLEGDKPWFIDWEMAGIYPYFLDLARFAYIYYDVVGAFYISAESAEAFIEAYYEEMKKNSDFDIEKEQFLYDVAISAFGQNITLLEYDKPLDEIKDTMGFKLLKEIIQFLRKEEN